MGTDPSHFSDVTCSLCSRHNREVRVVATAAGWRLVAAVAAEALPALGTGAL